MFWRKNNPGPETRDWRDSVRRAVDLAVAFATLDERGAPAPVVGARGHADSRGADAPSDGAHPHRTPVRAPIRARRPGGGAPRSQHCIAPTVTHPLPGRRRRTARTTSAH